MTINEMVKDPVNKFRKVTLKRRVNELVEPPISGEAIKFIKIITALDAIEGNYRDIKRHKIE